MTAREMINFLEQCHPDEVIAFHTTQSNRVMQILGFNQALSSKHGAVVFDVDFSATEGKVVEEPMDKLKREKQRIEAKIAKLTEEQKVALSKKTHNYSKKSRSTATNIINDVLKEQGAVRRGRPPKKRMLETVVPDSPTEPQTPSSL